MAFGRFLARGLVSVVVVVVGVTALTWLIINLLRPDLRAGISAGRGLNDTKGIAP